MGQMKQTETLLRVCKEKLSDHFHPPHRVGRRDHALAFEVDGLVADSQHAFTKFSQHAERVFYFADGSRGDAVDHKFVQSEQVDGKFAVTKVQARRQLGDDGQRPLQERRRLGNVIECSAMAADSSRPMAPS